MQNLKRYAPILIILAALLWSVDGLLRVSLYVLPPITIVFYEHLIGFLLLVPVILPKRNEFLKITKKEWGSLLWVSLLSGVIGTLLYTAALGKINFIQFSVVVLLQQLQPIFEIAFGWIVLKEKISKDYLLWAVLALIGAYMLSFPSLSINLQTGAGTAVAALFAVGAAFAWGSSTAFSRYALLKTSPSVTTAIRFGFSTIIAAIFVLVLGATNSIETIKINQLGVLLVIALSTGMVALFIYYKGLKYTPVRIAAICELVWPLSAVCIDYFFFHKTLSGTQIIGSIILLNSIYQVSLRKKLHAGVND